MTKDQTTQDQAVVETETDPELEARVRDLCEKAADNGLLTMYRVANVWSELAGRRVREQQMYNYRTKEVIKGLVDGRATIDGAVEFLLTRVS